MADNFPITPGAGASARTTDLGSNIHQQHIFQAELAPAALDLASAATHQTTVSTTSVGLDDIPSDATHALISIEGVDIRWLDTGTAPTGTVGHKLAVDNYFWISGRQRLLDWRMIRISTAGSDATITTTFYKYA